MPKKPRAGEEPPQIQNADLAAGPSFPDEAGSLALDQDPFLDFADDSEGIQFYLYRLKPTSYKGIEIAGFVPPVLEAGAGIADVAEQHGGGLYEIRPRKGGLFMGSRRFRISGPPRVAVPAQAEPAPTQIQRETSLPQGTEIDGMPIGGTDREFMAMLTRIAMIRALQPPDLNAVILQKLLDGKDAPANPLANFAETMAAVREIAGDLGAREAGPNWTGLLEKALGTVNTYLQKLPTPRPASPARQITNQPPAPPAPPAAEEAQQVNIFQVQQLAQAAVAQIVAAYIKTPQLSIVETVDVLKLSIPHGNPQVNELIHQYKPNLKNMALLALDEAIDADEAEQAKFSLYFENCLNTFTGNQATN